MKSPKGMLPQTVPAAAGLRAVSGFDPMRFLRKEISRETGETMYRLELRYKKLWFRLACPNGRLIHSPLRVTERLAVYEARVYLDRNDSQPVSAVSVSKSREETGDGDFVKAAQDCAMDAALDEAGFGIQLCREPADREERPAECHETAPAAEAPAAREEKASEPETPAAQPAGISAAVSMLQSLSGTSKLASGKETPPPEETADDPEPGGQGPSVEPVPPAPDDSAVRAKYGEDMPVEEIRAAMTMEEAGALVIASGINKGMTMAEVARKRAASLKYYAYLDPYCGSAVRAAALLFLGEREEPKAG